MAAAGGAYVGKDGKLVIYGVEHDNDGPKVGGKGSVKMMEFAERYIVSFHFLWMYA